MIPPGLFAFVRAKEPGARVGSISQHSSAVFAGGNGGGFFRSHSFTAAKGFDTSDGNTGFLGYCGIGYIVLSHLHDLRHLLFGHSDFLL